MKKVFVASLVGLISSHVLFAQTYSVTVNNGYGSGNYIVGDTVHVWSNAYDTTFTFDYWNGDTSFLDYPGEWNASFIMPSQNVNLTAVTRIMPTYTIQHEQIMGVNNLKNVYSCFPDGMKGVIYIFHGTGGSAEGSISKTENRSFVDAAIADSFGVLITEAEEITLNTDLNGDGRLRWSVFPLDSVFNTDYANLKIITDTFINRGAFTNGTPRFAFGMSNGGSYSSTTSYLFSFNAGISYCASGSDTIFALTTTPFAFRMALYDDNAEVGPAGNYEAWQHDSTLQARGVCHHYLIHDRRPIYPERFARINGVSVSLSQNIFNELVLNGQIDSDNFALTSSIILSNIVANPGSYPIILALPVSIHQEVLGQVSAANAEHNFYSDWNNESLQFFNYLCSPPVISVPEIGRSDSNLVVYPNPVSEVLHIQGLDPEADYSITVTNVLGAVMYTGANVQDIPVAEFPTGFYMITIEQMVGCRVINFMKE